MKREIKFRAWDTERNQMLYEFDDIHIVSIDYGELVIGTGGATKDYYELELMQYIGLKDKNGKEIYQGDIIQTGTDKLMVITWSERFASFCIERDGWAFKHWFGEAFESKECEVKGNIYENPELLK